MAAKGSPLQRQCCAIDGGQRCKWQATFYLSEDLIKLARKRSTGGFGAKSSLDFAVDVRDKKSHVCADHAMDVMHNVFGKGLSDTENVRKETLLMDAAAWLLHTDRGLSAEEVENRRSPKHVSHIVGAARRKRSKRRIDDTMAEFERVEAICARAEEDGYAPDSNALQVLTGTRRLDNQKNESWCQVDMYDRSKDELVLLVEHARVHGLLPKTTRTYCCIHTAVRHCIIAARIEVPFHFIKLKWKTPEAEQMLRFFLQHPNVFKRRVLDTLCGIGELGMGSGHPAPYNAAERHSIVGIPSYRALSDFKPRATGAVLEPNAPVAAAFARCVRRRLKLGPDERILAYITVDKSDGGGEASFSLVDHLVEGIETRRILGAAWTPSGDVTMMTAEDARRELDIAGVDAATGVESCLLNVAGDVFGEGGFLAGLVPVKDESGVAALFRLWRALLVVEKIELVVMGTDFGMPNRKAHGELTVGAPTTLLEKPVWEWDEVPTFQQMIAPGWNKMPVLFIPDVDQHVFKKFIYAHYEIEWEFNNEKGAWGDLVFLLTGARLVRSKNGRGVWVCSRPGTTALCRVGDTLVSEILGTRTEAWQRELLSHIGTPHLGISDPQNTQRPFELTGAWKLFEEVGLKTAALIQKNARQLRNASRGRGLDGRQLTALAAIKSGRAALRVLMDMQKQAEARGHYSGEQRPRGGWPPTVLEAAQLAVDSSETWLKWNKKLGVKVPPRWPSSRWNEVVHEEVKRDGGRYLDVVETTRHGEAHQTAQLIQADAVHPPVTSRRKGLYTALEERLEALNAGTFPHEFASEPLYQIQRRAPVPSEDVDEDDFQVLEDTCAELRDRSGFSSLKTGARDKYVKGLTGRRSTPASRKLQLYRCCNSPSSIELVKIQVNAFGFDVQHARLIGVGAAFAGRGAPTPRPQRGPAVPVTQSGPRRPRTSTGPAPVAPQKAPRRSLRGRTPRGTQ